MLLDRKRGDLCAEVKGGSLVFDGREWVREVRGEMRLLNKDPFAQATQCMHDIVDLVRRWFRTPGGEPPFTYGAVRRVFEGFRWAAPPGAGDPGLGSLR